ncbi:DnaJ family molecular chaperone [Mesorhizobium koreense]|jgi:DnaJ like chaperone protein|uniref:DnaJ family molecular chaperone n=1 Tax=Mesorhizobium koreense TaxID=3074855 RepID=UPI00287B9A13|nr:DnaJ family molecular chaperone [Mesorhizobium sp. WR6]
MSIWTRIGDIVSRVSGTALSNALEAVRTLFAGDPELRRRVAFSVAMIALSAKMAKADGIVTQNEIRAFRQIFLVPENEARNVARLYDIAKQDIAGYEVYAERLAGMCGSGHPNCAMLEDILDGLFHIAKADGMVHEREVAFLRRISEIFEISPDHFESILARHADIGEADPYKVLGVGRDASFEEIRKHYRLLVRENHPDRAIARGLPEEFVAIASTRVAALNAAYEVIEKGRRRR